MAWWLEGAFPGILGGFETRQKQFFCIFLESGKKSKKKNFQEKSVKIGFFSVKIGFFGEKSVFFGKNRFLSEKIGDFSPIFFFPIFPLQFLFQARRYPIFLRKIGQFRRFFVPWFSVVKRENGSEQENGSACYRPRSMKFQLFRESNRFY